MKNIFEKSKKIFLEAVNYLIKEDFINAEKKFLESYKLTPDRISIVSNLIQIYIKQKNINQLDDFLKLNDNFKDTFDYKIGLGFLKFFKRKYNESLKICEEINSENLKQKIQTLNLRIKNLEEINEFEQALQLYKKILSLEEGNHINYYNFGTFLFKIGKPEESLINLYKALKIKKNFPGLFWNISLCELKLKNFRKGFSNYNIRWKNENNKKKYQSIKELKNLKDIENSKVLIWGDGDGGYGDNILFSRFLNYISKEYNNITFCTYGGLTELLRSLSKNIKVISTEQVNEKDYDFQIPLGDIPNLLNFQKFEEIPYYKLSIENDNKEKKLNLSKKKLNVGFAWCGNPNLPIDVYRSIPLKRFNKIINSENYKFFKLQTLLKPEEKKEFYSYNSVEDLGDKSFYDLAKCLNELDIIVSVDTSIIHLCGILNIKAYLLLNYNNFWTWFLDKKDTLWYPSIKIIKQKKFNDWSYVFEKLELELENLYNNKFKP